MLITYLCVPRVNYWFRSLNDHILPISFVVNLLCQLLKFMLINSLFYFYIAFTIFDCFYKIKMARLLKGVFCVFPAKGREKTGELLFSYSKHLFRSKNTLSSLQQSVSYFDRNHTCLRYFSRSTKSWFRSKRKLYNIVEIHEVSPRKAVPDLILRPDYADSGVANEPDNIQILNEDELKSMRQSCALAKNILEEVAKQLSIGVSTDELDDFAHKLCITYGAYPSPLNYRGYPKSICTSVNNIACHGIPDSRKLMDGDVISIDISVFHNGFHGDCAATFGIGNVDDKGQNLINIAFQCLSEAIKICRPSQPFCQIGKTISAYAKNHGFSVIPAFCGHGIGSCFHTPPNILHYDNDEAGEMQKGMIFTIEPVICEGRPDIEILEDGWTATTEDESRSAQFEHTILITETGAEILTVSSALQNLYH